MPNGKPGDHPVTDLVVHGYRGAFSPEIEALIIDIDGFTDDYATFDPFGDELNDLLTAAEREPSRWPELHRRLADRLAELQRG